jgi:ABC-type ATPase involved in cell division
MPLHSNQQIWPADVPSKSARGKPWSSWEEAGPARVRFSARLSVWRGPKSGQVIVNGVDLSTTNQKELKKLHRSMGVAFQNAALFDSLPLEENVALPLSRTDSAG